MNFKKMILGIECSVITLLALASQGAGGGPFVWSYEITEISASAMSDGGEHFLIGCDNGEYFVFDQFGNMTLIGNLRQRFHAVDIGENGNMVFGVENGVFFLDSMGRTTANIYPTTPVFCVSMAKDGSYAVAVTQKNVFLVGSQGIKWQYDIVQDSPEIIVRKAAISELGSVVAAAVQNEVFIFGSTSNSPRSTIPLESTVTSLEICPDTNYVAIGTEKGVFSLYDSKIPEKNGEKFSHSLSGSVECIASNSEHILVGTSTGEIVLFSLEEDILMERQTEGAVVGCDISDDGKFAVVLNSDGHISFFNISTETGWEFTIQEPLFTELSADGKYVAVTGKSSIYFFNNWESTFDGTKYFPYTSHGSFSLKNDLYKVWSYPVRSKGGFDFGDINGDGKNEVVFGSGKELIVLDHRGKLLWKKPFPEIVDTVHLHDLTGDAVPEIIIGFDDGRLNMDVWSGEDEQLFPFDFMDEFEVQPLPGDMGMEFIAAMDINQDGKIEIISGVEAGYYLNPRGILVFEYPSGDEEWYYSTSPYELSCALTDINNDGNLELVLGSYSPCSGNTVEDIDGCHVYVKVLDLKGNEIWTNEIGSEIRLLSVGVSDLDGDGQKEIVCTASGANNTYGRLFILDNKGNFLHERGSNSSIWFGGIADFEKDGFQEIIVTNGEGKVQMYDHELTLLKEFEIEQNVIPYVKGIADLDGNGFLEIVLVTDSGKLVILDTNLAELILMDFQKKPEVMLANITGCAINLLVRSPVKIELYSLKTEGIHPCSFTKTGVTLQDIERQAGIYFEIAQSHYRNLEFENARENYNDAMILYREIRDTDAEGEALRQFQRADSIIKALEKLKSGKRKFAGEEPKAAEKDFTEAKTILKELEKTENFPEVQEWLQEKIDECKDWEKACDELDTALGDLQRGIDEFENQNFEKAKEYFESALQTFEKYKLERSREEVGTYLKTVEKEIRREIDAYQKRMEEETRNKVEKEIKNRKYILIGIVLFVLVIYILGWKRSLDKIKHS